MTHARPTALLRLLLAALLALSAWLPAQAQQIAGTNIRASLTAEGPPVPGKTWTVALHFAPKSEDGFHHRDWVRKNVARICQLAGVPRVTAHGMRGAHSTFAIRMGATPELVAAALGHADPSTTRESYIEPGAVEAEEQRLALRLLRGGKK
jgi:integrase